MSRRLLYSGKVHCVTHIDCLFGVLGLNQMWIFARKCRNKQKLNGKLAQIMGIPTVFRVNSSSPQIRNLTDMSYLNELSLNIWVKILIKESNKNESLCNIIIYAVGYLFSSCTSWHDCSTNWLSNWFCKCMHFRMVLWQTKKPVLTKNR